MLAAPPITLTDLRHELETEAIVRLPATRDDYFALLDEQFLSCFYCRLADNFPVLDRD